MAHSATFIQRGIDLFFPPLCLVCGEEVLGPERLCAGCWADIRFVGQSSCFLCGDVLPGQVDEDTACDSCLRSPRIWDRGTSAVLYRKAGRDLVLRLKHQDRLDLVQPAARWMVSGLARLSLKDPVLIPIPLHRARLWKRRYNQSALLAKSIARQAGVAWEPKVLQRLQATPSLGHSTAEERAVIMAGTMSLAQNHQNLTSRNLVIVDDVMASGATFTEATRLLRGLNPASVSVLALARVSHND